MVGRWLLVDNDKGERYEMDLGTGAVVAVKKTTDRSSVPERPAAK